MALMASTAPMVRPAQSEQRELLAQPARLVSLVRRVQRGQLA